MTISMDRPIKRPRWKSRPVMIGAGAAAALVVVAVLALAVSKSSVRTLRVPAANLTIEPVAQGVFHDFTPLQGKVTPKDTLYLDTSLGGQVAEVLVQAGDRVVKGQPMIKFTNHDVELDVLQREAVASQGLTIAQQYQTTLEQSHAANERQLQQIDYDIVRLKRALDRRKDYEGQGVFPQEQLDQYKDELDYDLKQRPVQAATNKAQDDIRKAQLPEIKENIANLQMSMKQIAARLDDLTVKATATGRITVLDLKIGQNVKSGDRLAELVPDTGFKVAADVDEYYLPRVKTGQTAVADFNGKDVRLKAIRVYPQVKDGVFNVDLAFDGPQPDGLTTGAAVQGRLSLGGDQPALVLPAGAFLERSGGDYVFVVSSDGHHADRRRIKLGRRNSEQVEVLSGLKAGDRVVTSDYEGYEKLDRIEFQ
ncbi:MAG TPA: efflux RND transporter periplasmic adaptor subunit [Caulobacteraceae bacterium]